MWLYSSLEHPITPGNATICEEQILALLAHVHELEKTYEEKRPTPGVLLIGSLHKKILQIFQKYQRVKEQTEEHFKFIFRREVLPMGRELPDGLEWSTIRAEDISLVLSRTAIPYTA